MAEQSHSTLPPQILPRFNLGPRGAYGTSQGLCDHSSHQRGVVSRLLKSRPLVGLLGGKVGDLAHDWRGLLN